MASLKRPGDFKARVLISSLGAALLAAASGGADGATASSAIMVSVTVASTCTVTANPLSFGTYQPGQGALSAYATLAVLCTKGAPFTVALSAGTAGGTVAQRVMTMGTNRLGYNLYTTATHTAVWGDGSQSSATVSGAGRGLAAGAVTQTVYGQVPDAPANADLAPGFYTDTVIVTVAY
jgi:spore coat protein U-like protein